MLEGSIIESRPRYRWNPGLRESQQERHGERIVVLRHPDTGAFFELGNTEYEIARAFDTGRPVEAVLGLRREAGEPLEASEFSEFVTELVGSGILLVCDDTEHSGAPPASEPDRRALLERLLTIEVAALKPDVFFSRTIGWVRPLLGTPVLVLTAAAFLGALWVVLGHWGEVRASIGSIFGGATLAAVWGIFAVVVVVHEMAHGYVCTYYGGRVRSLGFLLLYGRPCAYCDVSDAWLFGKTQRILVMAAGSLVELGLWAFATLLWRITSPETWIHLVALVIMMVCGFGTLFNFNPLLKYDGYYMLSDALEIPNLRERAFRDLKHRLWRQEREPATPGQRHAFLVYGVFALVYSVLVLGFLGVTLDGWIEDRWGAQGRLVFWSVIGLLTASAVVRDHPGLVGALRTPGFGRRGALGILTTVVVLSLVALLPWSLKVSSESHLEPRARTVVRSPVEANIDSVHVREGEVVDGGYLLVQLATRDLDYALTGARAEVEELQANLLLLESGARPQELDMALRRAEAASTRVEFDRLAYERAHAGLQSDLVSRESVEVTERQLRVSEKEERAARKALELLEAGARPEQLQAMRARLESVRAQVARLQEDLGLTNIRAPHEGRVLTARPERLVGRYVERGDSLLVLADVRWMILEIPVSEKDVADVAVGAPVRFKSRSFPTRIFTGEVVEIAPVAAPGRHQRTVVVRSTLDNADGLLRPDTSGFAKIYCGKRPLGMILARRVIRMLRTEFWALW